MMLRVAAKLGYIEKDEFGDEREISESDEQRHFDDGVEDCDGALPRSRP
jgi:hypothetical protein